MRTIEVQLYQYDELSPEAQAKARDWYLEGGLDYDWWDGVYDGFQEVCKILGVEIDQNSHNVRYGGSATPMIFFSGFYHQGSYAGFEGEYSYKKGAAKAIRAYCNDEELIRIADALQDVQRRNFYRLIARIRLNRDNLDVEVYDKDDRYREIAEESDLRELMDDLADWLYKTLQNEYEWLTSDEEVAESIRANEYEFDEDGRRA